MYGLLFLVLSGFGGFAKAETFDGKCLDSGKIRYHKFGKLTEENVGFCFNKTSGILESASCSKKSGCEARNVLAKKDLQAVAKAANADFGAPGFQACRTLGGEPQLIEYFDGESWVPLDRCSFSTDKSFANTARLLKK